MRTSEVLRWALAGHWLGTHSICRDSRRSPTAHKVPSEGLLEGAHSPGFGTRSGGAAPCGSFMATASRQEKRISTLGCVTGAAPRFCLGNAEAGEREARSPPQSPPTCPCPRHIVECSRCSPSCLTEGETEAKEGAVARSGHIAGKLPVKPPTACHSPEPASLAVVERDVETGWSSQRPCSPAPGDGGMCMVATGRKVCPHPFFLPSCCSRASARRGPSQRRRRTGLFCVRGVGRPEAPTCFPCLGRRCAVPWVGVLTSYTVDMFFMFFKVLV